MLEQMNVELPHFTCRICHQESDAFQISVYQNIEFLACQNCGSVTTSPIPDQVEIEEANNASRLSQAAPFPSTIEKKHFLKHISDLRKAAKTNKCLDIKAGNGVRTEMARVQDFRDIIGIDSNQYSIETAQKRFSRGTFINTSLTDYIASHDEKFDAVISYHSLENTNDPDAHLKTLKQVLNPKALVYFSLCDGNHFMVPHTFMKWKEVYYPNRVHYISRDGLDMLLERHGFKILKRYKRFLPYQHVIARLVK